MPPRLGTVAPVQVMRLYPLLGNDGRSEGQLPAQNGGGDDLGELVDLARSIAIEQLQALLAGAAEREPVAV